MVCLRGSQKVNLIFGIGINDANYQIKKKELIDGKYRQTWACPYYSTWKGMITRCHSEKFLEKHPWYLGVTVCEEWLTFSNFKSWMETQDWKGKALDKDLFGNGKLYSPENCIFLDQKLNTFLSCSKRKDHLLGAFWHKGSGKYQILVSDYDNTGKTMGYVESEVEAHFKWLSYKIATFEKVIESQTNLIIKDRLIQIKEKLVFCYENEIPVTSITGDI